MLDGVSSIYEKCVAISNTSESAISSIISPSCWLGRALTLLCATALCVLLSAPAHSQTDETLVVVVNANSTTSSLSKKELIDIYMGRFNKFPNGDSVTPVDFDSPNEDRELFYSLLVGKSERKINAYWSRLLFSGRATPPEKVDSMAQVAAIVLNNINALAYVKASDVQQGMKIVYEF